MPVDIRKALRKLQPHLLKAHEDNLNEADTVQRIIKVFEEVLGYDPMSEITRESQIHDRYVDIALKLNGSIRLIVEVKSAGTELRDRHIEQAQHYAAEGNIPWALLTNGVAWNLYHLSFSEGVEYVRAFSIDLLTLPVDKAADQLAVLHRQSLLKGELEEYWEHQAALSPTSIGRAIFMEDTLKLIRREIRRREDILIDEEDLARAIHEMFSTETRELLGPPRIKRRTKPKARPAAEADATPDSASDPMPAPECASSASAPESAHPTSPSPKAAGEAQGSGG